MRFIFNKLIRLDKISKDEISGFYNIDKEKLIKMDKFDQKVLAKIRILAKIKLKSCN